MIKRKSSFLVVVCVAALFIIPLVRKSLHHYRPVTKTGKLEATITSAGKVESIPVYKMAGFPNRILVQLPKNLRTKNYEWFGIYKYGVNGENYGVNRLSGVKTFPYRHHNHDMAFGIGIDDPKTQDDWIIRQTDNTVEFSNSDFKITLRKY